MNEKGKLIVEETDTGRSPFSLVHIDVGTVPISESHDDAGIVPIPESHVDTGTVPILESLVEIIRVRVHASMLTGVQTPQGAMTPECRYGCHEPRIVQGCSVTVLRQN